MKIFGYLLCEYPLKMINIKFINVGPVSGNDWGDQSTSWDTI